MSTYVDTVSDVTAYMTAPLSAVNVNHPGGSGGERDSWKFGPTYTKVALDQHLLDGWPDGVARVREIAGDASKVPLAVRNVRRRRVRGDSGTEVDITAYWRGRADIAWERCVRDASNPVTNVRIVPLLCGVCTLKPDEFFYRGAAAVRLCDLLTDAGYNVAITAAAVGPFVSVGRRDDHYAVGIPLKPYTAPLEINVLTAVLCEVGFTRHYVFRHLGAAPFAVDTHCGLYHREGVAKLPSLARLAVPEQSREVNVYLPYDIRTREQAEAWVRESLAQIAQGDLTAAE